MYYLSGRFSGDVHNYKSENSQKRATKLLPTSIGTQDRSPWLLDPHSLGNQQKAKPSSAQLHPHNNKHLHTVYSM